MTIEQLDQLSINTIRTLSMDAVQEAKSGHPGTPMALAPLVSHRAIDVARSGRGGNCFMLQPQLMSGEPPCNCGQQPMSLPGTIRNGPTSAKDTRERGAPARAAL